jgi:hypothetical protein
MSTPETPIPCLALCDAATPGARTVESIRNAEGEYSSGGPEASVGFDAFQLVDENGRVILDTLNRDPLLGEIKEEVHEHGIAAWDIRAKSDLALIVRLPPEVVRRVYQNSAKIEMGCDLQTVERAYNYIVEAKALAKEIKSLLDGLAAKDGAT